MTTLHPEMATILLEQQANPMPDPATLPIEQARHNFLANTVTWNQPLPLMPANDAMLGGIHCRLLSPAGARPGLVVFVHGGGWTFGAPASHERFARLLAEQVKVGVLVPDYRLAPEHPAPAGTEDVLSVLAALRPDGPVVLCGDSAGPTSRLLRRSRARRGPLPCYPCYMGVSRLCSIPAITGATATGALACPRRGCVGTGATGSAKRKTHVPTHCTRTLPACRLAICWPRRSTRSVTTA